MQQSAHIYSPLKPSTDWHRMSKSHQTSLQFLKANTQEGYLDSLQVDQEVLWLEGSLAKAHMHIAGLVRSVLNLASLEIPHSLQPQQPFCQLPAFSIRRNSCIGNYIPFLEIVHSNFIPPSCMAKEDTHSCSSMWATTFILQYCSARARKLVRDEVIEEAKARSSDICPLTNLRHCGLQVGSTPRRSHSLSVFKEFSHPLPP